MFMLAALALAGTASAQLVDPMCQKLRPQPGNEVRMKPWELTIDAWNQTSRSYTNVGTVYSKALAQIAGDFEADHEIGISVHGANINGIGHDPNSRFAPPAFFGASFKNKYYKIDEVEFASLNTPEVTRAVVSEYAYGLAPSGMLNIANERGEHTGYLLAGGNPFIFNGEPGPVPAPPTLFKGSVAFLPAETSQTCPMIFPEPAIDDMGKVTNTVRCHRPTGICVFSVWKFMDPANVLDPDCLYWCIVNDIDAPTSCVTTGIAKWTNGSDICMTELVPNSHFGGGVHGFELGITDPADDSIFELILIFTGDSVVEGPGGVSHMEKVRVQRVGNDLVTLSEEIFGSQLWEDTVTLPYDAGLDHGWLQDGGDYLWISAFREANPGVHVVDYETGELVLSLHGFNGSVADQYTYPAGVVGYGRAGQPGSFFALATSTLKGLLPPIPDPCTIDFSCGVGVVYLVDISDIQLPVKQKSPISV
eukprot:TRINITY_DN3807_c0_g1_i1.p1 TRINITY_DN3807_c0_g1~~TRINITY_DN3807_c0_g1_i1.p1  ORF type:complete len:488 (+),score=112.41 TRINITY_DN3807_c0_g1_i1:35-1465(+)